MNTPAHDDEDASNEPGPGFSPGPGFMPPPPPPAETLIARPTASPILPAAAAAPIGKRVKRWHLAGNATRGLAIFLALVGLFDVSVHGFFNNLVPSALLAAPLIYLLTTSKTIPAGAARRG